GGVRSGIAVFAGSRRIVVSGCQQFGAATGDVFRGLLLITGHLADRLGNCFVFFDALLTCVQVGRSPLDVFAGLLLGLGCPWRILARIGGRVGSRLRGARLGVAECAECRGVHRRGAVGELIRLTTLFGKLLTLFLRQFVAGRFDLPGRLLQRLGCLFLGGFRFIVAAGLSLTLGFAGRFFSAGQR